MSVFRQRRTSKWNRRRLNQRSGRVAELEEKVENAVELFETRQIYFQNKTILARHAVTLRDFGNALR